MKNTNPPKKQITLSPTNASGRQHSKSSKQLSQSKDNSSGSQTISKQNSSSNFQNITSIKSQQNLNTNNSNTVGSSVMSNTMLNSVNNGSSRQQMFKPVLRAKDISPVESRQTGPILKKQGSGPVEKKSSKTTTNQIAMNESTFNYEERKNQRSRDTTPNQSNRMVPLQDSLQNGVDNANKMQTRLDQDTQESESEYQEQRIRPSDEVQYSSYNQQDNRKSIQQNDYFQGSYANDFKGTTSSFKVVNESQKSEFKDVIVVEDTNNQQFEIIKEEIKDDDNQGYEQNDRHNSDFKRFIMDEDHQNEQSLRIGQQSNFNPNSFIPSLDYNQVNEKAYNKLQENGYNQSNTKTRNARDFYNVQDENSLYSSNYFIQGNRNIPDQSSPHSFGSPDKKDLLLQQKQIEMQQAHILSFSDQNQLYQVEYPPLQQRDTIQQMSEGLNQEYTDLSPTSMMQQRRLNEILRTSQTDSQSLNNSIQQDKMDEKKVNTMIDMEKNYVILQYENILQQLNLEFQKLLQKTKETEETQAQKDSIIKTQARILQEKEDQQFQLDQINRQLTGQVQDLLLELEIMTQRQHQQSTYNNDHASSTNDNWKMEKDFLEQKISQLQNKLNFTEQTESDLRDQIGIHQQKLRASDQKYRVKEEEMFQVTRDNSTLLRDFQNMKDIEYQHKQELQIINSQRLMMENEIQELKQQLCSQQLQSRSRDQEIDHVIRENRNLRGTIEIQQQSYNECLAEMGNSKQSITELERKKLQMRNHVEKQEREFQSLQQDLKRQQVIIEQEKDRVQNIEDHYKSEIQKILSQNLNQKQPQWEKSYQNENREIQEQKIRFNEELAYRSVNQNLNNTNNFKEKQDFQKPHQENHNTFNSPHRNQAQNQQTYFSPQNEFETQKQVKNNVAQPFMWGSQANNKVPQHQPEKNQIYPPPKQSEQVRPNQQQFNVSNQQRNNIDNTSLNRRKTILNQNESQLHSVLSWDQTGTQQHHLSVGSRSLERNDNAILNSRFQKQFNQHDYNAQNRNQSSNNNQSQNTEANTSQQSFNSSKSGAVIVNQFNRGHQDQDMQPAGKKSTVINQSPLDKKNKNFEQQLTHLQNSLSSLQMDKERIENEYRKVGHPKNKQQITKKQEMEFEVEIVNKNIQNLKQKLREMNAF